MKLTDSELKNLPKHCPPFNAVGGVIINKDILKSLIDELLEHRKNM